LSNNRLQTKEKSHNKIKNSKENRMDGQPIKEERLELSLSEATEFC
jgi:hypothetical protein